MITTSWRLFRAILVTIIVSTIWEITSYAADTYRLPPWPPKTVTKTVTKNVDAVPSRADLLLTMDHIVSLVHETLADLQQEKGSHALTQKELDATKQADLKHQKEVETQTNKLNTLQDKYDAKSKKLLWYQFHYWGSWIIFGLGIAACIFLAVMKLTGRLAIAVAPIVAKIP